MFRTQTAVRGALLLGAGAVFLACKGDDHIVIPVVNNAIFTNYVALGNSITAGYQSGGINDSTQRQSYALLLARQMGTRYAYPALLAPGCPPPVSNLLTQARVGGATSTSTTCLFRVPASVTAALNNVAVPNAASADPIAPVGPGQTPLTTIFLGGKTQVQKALDVDPTFATVWIGNNDVLAAAIATGLAANATPLATFVTNYSSLINQLTAGAAGVKGVLIGVGQVANTAIVFQAGVLAVPAANAAAAQVAGRPVVLDPVSCAGANALALVSFQYLVDIRGRPAAEPGTVYCQKRTQAGGATDQGDFRILDVAEQTLISTRINDYNNYIRAKADSIGFAYYDPNIVLGSVVKPTIPAFPNLASATQPFGQYFSLDGVHPSAAAHVLIANELIKAINTKYSTTLPLIP